MCSVHTYGLPLGFITSPTLSNIYMKEFDNIIYGKIKRIPELQNRNPIYTRYADDLVISFKTNSVDKEENIEAQVKEIVTEQLKRLCLRLNIDKNRSYNFNVTNHIKITGINIVKTDSGSRRLSVGRTVKNNLFWNAISAYKDNLINEYAKIKGMKAFVYSVEKDFEKTYSSKMTELIKKEGFSSLTELIDSL